MSNEYTTYINNELKAAREKEGYALIYLSNVYPGLNCANRNGMNAAMILAEEGDYESCMFLSSYYTANYNDFVNGALMGGHVALANKFLEKIDENKRNYLSYAYYAAKGNLLNHCEEFLKNVAKEQINQNLLAGAAASGGHEQLTFHFLDKISPNEYNPEFIMKLAATATSHNHESLAVKLLSVIATSEHDYELLAAVALQNQNLNFASFCIKQLPKNNRNYNRFARNAVRGGHQGIAEYYLNKLDESERDYLGVAQNAAGFGEREVAEHFINKLDKTKRDYNSLTEAAAKSGFIETCLYFLRKSNLTFNDAAGFAAQGNHRNLAWYFLNQLPVAERDYNLVARKTARVGLHNLVEVFLKMLPDQSKCDYQGVIAQAREGHFHTLAEHYENKLKSLAQPQLKESAVLDLALPNVEEKSVEHVNADIKKRKRDEEDEAAQITGDIDKENSKRPTKRKRRDPLEIDTVEGKKNKGITFNFERQSKLKAIKLVYDFSQMNDSDIMPEQQPITEGIIAEVVEDPTEITYHYG